MFIQWNVSINAVSKILIIFGSVRIVHRKLTVTDVSDFGAGSVFVPVRAATSRLFSRVSTIFKHQVLHSHFADMAKAAIDDKMVFID